VSYCAEEHPPWNEAPGLPERAVEPVERVLRPGAASQGLGLVVRERGPADTETVPERRALARSLSQAEHKARARQQTETVQAAKLELLRQEVV
jgi:hypothetical protein